LLGDVRGAASDVEHDHVRLERLQHASGEWGRRANGEWSPANMPTCCSNDLRTTASCSLALIRPG
jgi:hypothetical protein